MNNKILLRFDDICPTMNWQAWDQAIRIMKQYNCKPLIGVIPNCQDPDLKIDNANNDFWNYIKELQNIGFTIAMHGYKHLLDSEGKALVTKRRESEFAGLSYNEQLYKLQAGKQIMESHGINTDIFFAPAHSYDENTIRALKACGFKYMSDGKTLKSVTREGILCLPCRTGGLPRMIYKGAHTAVIHAHEWERNKKAFVNFKKFVEINNKDIISFDEFKNLPTGNLYTQGIFEKLFVFYWYNIRPLASKFKQSLLNLVIN